MQTRALKILSLSAFLILVCLSSGKTQIMLTTADSLFKARQYTQSFELYSKILKDNGQYSPAMLLKMAYIQEGLGHVSKSIHYLQLYYQATNDVQALTKIEQLAEKNKLEGYDASDKAVLEQLLKKYKSPISIALFAVVLFLLALMVYQKRKHNERPLWTGLVLLLFLTVLFVQVNYSGAERQGIVAKRSYLMSGPSAGASVVAIIGEGHQLKVTGQKDIWLRVQWNNREAFVKEDKLLFASI